MQTPENPSAPMDAGTCDRRARARVVLVSLACLLVVSAVDYLTGDELLFFLFYFLPVALCGWFLRLRGVLGMAGLSGGAWFAADLLSGHLYSHTVFRYWNGAICTLSFVTIGFAVHRLKRALDARQRAQHELATALDELTRSTAEIRTLQTDLQVVCAWTKRIRVNGQWIPFDKFLAENLHLSVSHGISPEAFEKMQELLDQDRTS